MSDSQVLTVAIAGQWRVGVPWHRNGELYAICWNMDKDGFPICCPKSQFNARVGDLWAVLVRRQQVVGQGLQTETDGYEWVDCSLLPSCRIAQAASQDRHWLSGEMGRG
ncbi:MAG: hypothetical protein K8I30_09725, partial [Anaerolineae bacterium]|nr:hypothetical protein [Anaerolineae bacterium]